MNLVRRMTRAAVAGLVVLLVAPGLSQAAWGQAGVNHDDDNEATAVNTTDGASLFRLAFSIVKVTDNVVDQENLAVAYASCTDCRTVSLAFQVVIVVGDADYVAPVNQAGALNDKCTECLTFASATQLVIGVDGPVTLTPEGRRRVALLALRMAALEGQIDRLTAAQLATEVNAIEQELIAILDEELVPAGPESGGGGGGGDGSGSTTTTAPPATTTSTTETSSTTPSTTAPPSAPSTTVDTAPSTTAPVG